MDACFRTYLSLCRSFPLGPPWNCLAVDPCAFLGPAEPDAALAHLVAQHPEPLLRRSGLVQRSADGEITLHRFLAAAEVPLVALRDPLQGSLINLMTSGGCVAGDPRPLF